MRDLNRIPVDGGHRFAGHQIDRGQPVRFRLNGREIDGYAGDTLLSAAISSGFVQLGTHLGSALGLRTGMGLAAKPRGAKGDDFHLLPLDRTPVTEGADLELQGVPRRRGLLELAKGLTGKSKASLNLDLDTAMPVPAAFGAGDAITEMEADIAIVGGGIAGLSAARRALERGKSVVLIERRGYLGGNAVLFGKAEGQEAPETLVAKLAKDVEGKAQCFVFTEALDISARQVVAHQVLAGDGSPYGRLLRISARRIVLATGSTDRLPVFQGNRLPGVFGLEEVYHLASAYGVWPARGGTVFACSDNTAYNLALLGQEAGLPVIKIFDSRIDPQSRYVEFAKASGIRSEAGLRVARVASGQADASLLMALELSWEGSIGQRALLRTAGLVASGGWQPELTLWHRAGGHIVAREDGIAHAVDGSEHFILAGSAAGFLSNPAVLQSGALAADEGGAAAMHEVDDPQIDPAFESPQGVLPIATGKSDATQPPAYFGSGFSLVACPRETGPRRLFHRDPATTAGTAEEPIIDRALTLSDVTAMAVIDERVSGAFDAVVQERCVVPQTIARAPVAVADAPVCAGEAPLPHYLTGRFGLHAQIWRIEEQTGTCTTGDLLFANSDQTDPLQAAGVVLSGGNNGRVYAAADGSADTLHLVARSAAGICMLTLARG